MAPPVTVTSAPATDSSRGVAVTPPLGQYRPARNRRVKSRTREDGRPLPMSFVSKDEITAIILPEAIAKAGTHTVTLKCDAETFPESHRAHLVVGFKPERESCRSEDAGSD